VTNYTNASTIISDEYRDAADNNGVFSGLMDYKGGVPEWPLNVSTRLLRRSAGDTDYGSTTWLGNFKQLAFGRLVQKPGYLL
jgi:hypothetical protein